MSVDLTGGMELGRDHFFAERPADPDTRESASLWVFDDQGAIGLPRIGIEAVAGHWDQRGMQVNVAFPDGRAAVVRNLGEGRSPVDEDGVCRTLAAGALELCCVEPFRTLTARYEGEAVDTTTAELAVGFPQAPTTTLRMHVELTCAAPPWVSGTLGEEAKRLFTEGFGTMISPRYEQLCTARGTVELGGDRWDFTGTALRIHRQGPRDVQGFWGHAWPSALFPSGRGFGALTFPERPGEPTFNEGYVLDAGADGLRPARLVDAPWLRRLDALGEDVSFTLRTEDGEDVTVEGEVVLAACMPPDSVPDFPPALQQAGVRYRWDGEETYGMLERSIPADLLER